MKLLLCIPAGHDASLLDLPADPRVIRDGVLHLPANPHHFGSWPRVYKGQPNNGGTYAAGDFNKHIEALSVDVPKRVPVGYAGAVCLDIEHIDQSDLDRAMTWTQAAVWQIRDRCPAAKVYRYGGPSLPGLFDGDMASVYQIGPVTIDKVHPSAVKAHARASHSLPIAWGQYHDSLGDPAWRSKPLPSYLLSAIVAACLSAREELVLWAPCKDAASAAITSRVVRDILDLMIQPEVAPMPEPEPTATADPFDGDATHMALCAIFDILRTSKDSTTADSAKLGLEEYMRRYQSEYTPRGGSVPISQTVHDMAVALEADNALKQATRDVMATAAANTQ